MSFWQAARREASGALRSFRYDFVQVLLGQRGSRRVLAVTGLTALVAAGGVGTAFAVAGGGRPAPHAGDKPAVVASAPNGGPVSDTTGPTPASGGLSTSPSASATPSGSAAPESTAGSGTRPSTRPSDGDPTPEPGPTSSKPKPPPSHHPTPSASPTPSSPSPSPSTPPDSNSPSAE